MLHQKYISRPRERAHQCLVLEVELIPHLGEAGGQRSDLLLLEPANKYGVSASAVATTWATLFARDQKLVGAAEG